MSLSKRGELPGLRRWYRRKTYSNINPSQMSTSSKTSKFCYLLIDLRKVVWWAALIKTVSPFFCRNWKDFKYFLWFIWKKRVKGMHFTKKRIFISKIFPSFVNRLHIPEGREDKNSQYKQGIVTDGGITISGYFSILCPRSCFKTISPA